MGTFGLQHQNINLCISQPNSKQWHIHFSNHSFGFLIKNITEL